jgi:hypothetical protein
MDTILKWLKVTQNLIIVGLSIVAIIALISATYNYYKKPATITVKEYVPTTEIKEVTKIKRVEVPVEKVVTIEKEVIVEKLTLPEWLKTDPNKQILATAEIPPYKGKTNAVSVLDTKTGASEIIAKQIPRSLFGLANEREIGIRYGYGYFNKESKFQDEGAVYGRWDFLRIGNAYLGVYGEGTTRGDAKAQLSLGYKF